MNGRLLEAEICARRAQIWTRTGVHSQCCCPSLPSQRQWLPRVRAASRFSGQKVSQSKNRNLKDLFGWNGDANIGSRRRWARPPPNAVASTGEEAGGGDRGTRFRDWVRRKVDEKQKEQIPPGEKVMRLVATATSAPVAQYIAEPVTTLHTLDPRVKEAWLLALVVVPSRAHISIRLGLVAFLLLATVCSLPRRIWQDQLGRMAFLSGLLFVFTALGTDGVPPVVHTRTPPPSFEGLPEVLPSLTGYSYVLFKFGPLQLTRKGLALAIGASCLSFTVLQSATLCLTTTTPEQLAAGLRWFLVPLLRFRAPVDEIILTLLLSLRFIGLVFDEVRNIALAVVARGVQWKALKIMETIDVLFTLCGRLFKNLLSHAEKISEAMVARGFKGDPSRHRIYFLTPMSLTLLDKLAIFALILLVGVTMFVESLVPI